MSATRLLAAPLIVLALLVAACSSAPAAVQTPGRSAPPVQQPTEAPEETEDSDPGPAEPDATPGTALTACELVTPADIEAAIGLEAGTVSPGELKAKGTVLDAFANECRYDDDEWGGLVVSVTPTDGINTYDAVHDVFGDDAEKLDGIGDGALWFPENDRGYFLKGSVLVMLQYTYLTAGDFDTFRDPTVSVGTAAVSKI
jgi:hypothetical protein